MADASERWRPHLRAPFDVPSQPPRPVQPAAEDRSWMPKPSVCLSSGVDWHKNWQQEWERSVQWASQHDQAFHSRIEAAEAALAALGLARPFDPRLKPARDAVSKVYCELNARYDAYTKSLPFVRY